MVTVVRTPMRVSLFGGGTDYPAYFRRNGGSVIGFAIDKYIYISSLLLNAHTDYRFRVRYSTVELVDRADAIRHPVVRALLAHYGWDQPTDFSIQADLPASAGLASSSAFTVGMVNVLSHLKGIPRTRMELAREAIHTEQALLKENVGVQDQLHAAFGGFNRFDFSGEDTFRITPVHISGSALHAMTQGMVLVYTGLKRNASEVVAEQLANTRARKVDAELGHMLTMVDEAQKVLESGSGESQLADIAALLHESWALKRGLSSGISSQRINELYDHCLRHGALGGKLCGAGGGGFLLMVVPPERRPVFEAAVGVRNCIGFDVDFHGTTVLGRM